MVTFFRLSSYLSYFIALFILGAGIYTISSANQPLSVWLFVEHCGLSLYLFIQGFLLANAAKINQNKKLTTTRKINNSHG